MPDSRVQHFRHRSGTWIAARNSGIFYRRDSQVDQEAATPSIERFPSPLIAPRRTRPHAIHIVTYPPGYVPRELRPDTRPKGRPQKSRDKRRSSPGDLATPLAAALTNNTSTTTTSSEQRSNDNRQNGKRNSRRISRDVNHSHKRISSSTSSSQLLVPVLGKLIASFSGRLPSTSESPPVPTGVRLPPAYDDVLHDSTYPTPSSPVPHPSHSHPHLRSHSHPAGLDRGFQCPSQPRHSTDMAVARSAASPAHVSGMSNHRNSFMSVRSTKSAVSSFVTEVPKPVASGSGVSCSILLAERNIFLHGFDHDGHRPRDGQAGTALLRGQLQLNVTKNVKIKAIQLKLLGRARTEWPEGIPPLKQDVSQEESLRTQVLTFYNVMHDGWETEYGNQCTYTLKNGSANSSSTNLANLNQSRPTSVLHSVSPRPALTAKELKRLSLQSTQSRSFGKGESGAATTTQAKGFKVFYPGTYDYSFELPIDHHQLETIKLQYGSVKWELHASIDRAGAFKPNLHGTKEVSIVRLPDQMSLETTEPISISRQWDDQLHYDIVISGKSFPIGSKIPIAFKLTPLAKVQVHKLKVYVTESIEYWTADKRVTRKDAGRKILLLEKVAGKPLDSNWSSSEVSTIRGGELSAEQRRQAREIANLRRTREAQRRGRSADPLPEPTNNLLGDLDLGLEHMWGSTEIEANVQLPTCQMMAKNKDLRLHPDCSWKSVNVYHWIKIVLRISRIDPDDPSGTKRRHFEISIDSPFTVLNCRATQANTNLPAYSNPQSQPATHQSACGCADSATVGCDGSSNSSSGTLPGVSLSSDALPLPPQAAHLSHSTMNPATDFGSPTRSVVDLNSHNNEQRPIHLLRVPSFQPPAFDDDTAPPPAPVLLSENPEAANAPLMTPPPQYDVVVGTPSVDGLADYFCRLADYGFVRGDGNDSGSDEGEDQPARILDRSGRVNVRNPRTPGGRMPSRSMEISRPPIDLDLANLPNRQEPGVLN